MKKLFEVLWTWVKAVAQRIGDLVIKLIAVKTVAALAVTITYSMQDKKTTADFIVVAFMWAGVVGVRYLEKVAGVLKNPATERIEKEN